MAKKVQVAHFWSFNISKQLAGLAIAVIVMLTASANISPLQAQQSVSPEYERQLRRLAEILGSVHHLREVCQAKEGQLWRDQMIKLINAENPSTAQRARLVRSFNQGYRSYRRTYRKCTQAATLAISRFIDEGARLSQAMARQRLDNPRQNAPATPGPDAAINR